MIKFSKFLSNLSEFEIQYKLDKKYPNQLNRIYNIWKPINDTTAETFYENKYSYPFFPEDAMKKDQILSYNSKDYENIGLKNQKMVIKFLFIKVLLLNH